MALDNSLVESVGVGNTDVTTHAVQDEVVIAVMGSTGTGKSSFIRLISGDTSVHVGDSLESETSEIQVVRFFEPKSRRRVVIVDTPGFDDSRAGVTDTDILREISTFLVEQYDKKKKLNGLVYFQRITDPRFSGQSVRNLRMFKNLCGSENYKNVVVLTTFWDRVATREGFKREEVLKTRFFKELVDGGAHFMRHEHKNVETGGKVLEHIFTLLPTNVRIQEEIRAEGKLLEETAAGSVHSEEIERMMAKHKAEMASLQEEMETLHAKERETMKEELDKLRQALAYQEQEMLELKKGLDEAKGFQEQLKKGDAEKKELGSKHEQEHGSGEALEERGDSGELENDGWTPWRGDVESDEVGTENPTGTDDRPEVESELKEEEPGAMEPVPVVAVPRNERQKIADTTQWREPIGIDEKSTWGTLLAPQRDIFVPKQNGGCCCCVIM